jgi:hypothetical protein
MLFLVCACGESTADKLVLSELRSHALPDGYEPSGASLSSGGEILLWSARQPDLLLITPSGRQTRLDLGSHDAPTAAAFLSGDSAIEALFGSTGRVLQSLKSGRLVSERFLPTRSDSSSIITAALAGTSWVYAVRANLGDVRLMQEAANGMVRQVALVSHQKYKRWLPDTLAQLSVNLYADNHLVVMSLIWPPFHSFVLGSDGRVLQTLKPQYSAYGLTKADTTAVPIALTALPLEPGFLQTYVDLRSDRREFAVFSADGRELRRIDIQVPLGYVDVHPPTGLVLAIRRTDVVEAVVYRWERRQAITKAPTLSQGRNNENEDH